MTTSETTCKRDKTKRAKRGRESLHGKKLKEINTILDTTKKSGWERMIQLRLSFWLSFFLLKLRVARLFYELSFKQILAPLHIHTIHEFGWHESKLYTATKCNLTTTSTTTILSLAADFLLKTIFFTTPRFVSLSNLYIDDHINL